ncbi:hypothetical protein F2Q69_00041140 [Brassica cretica]|uniref:Uncharacterized protein n=1 Tax=Brassica cretica TaxID=69181 RepID=A0A8S9NIH3_BRACR|nr:hypothetical protein F2Q69_00041140 [Brassica cretica]
MAKKSHSLITRSLAYIDGFSQIVFEPNGVPEIDAFRVRSRVSHGVDLGQISPGGFAGVALRRCLCRSGQYSASTVSPMSPLTAALLPRTGLSSCFTCCKELWLLRSSSFRRKLVVVICLSWCSAAGIPRALLVWWDQSPAIKPLLPPASTPPLLHIPALYFSLDSQRLADPASPVLLSMSPSGWSAVPWTVLRVSTRRSPPRFVTVPSLCPLTLLSPPLPPCFISSVYRRVAAGLGDSNRWLWVSTASLERWRGRGEPDLSWRRRQAGRSRVSHGVDLGQISPGGFAGVALRRCLCRSGQYSASTVSPMSPLTAALVRTSPSCSKLKRRFETHCRGLLSRFLGRVSPPVSPAVRSSGSSVLQASEGSWSLSSASLGVLLLESLVLCSRGGTRVQPLNLCFHQPVLEIATYGVDFIACAGRTRACQPCFACPSFDVAFGMVCGALDRSPVVILY